MKKLLIIGPSVSRSNGGMAAVIKQESESEFLNDNLHIKTFSSYVDGSLSKRVFHSGLGILKGLFTIPHYDILHIHMTSKGSMIRKLFYIQEGLLFHKKIIVQIHTCDYFIETLNMMPEWVQDKTRNLLNRCDRILCLSKSFKSKLESELGLHNCIYFPNGIDLEEYKYREGRNRNNILFLGKIRESKGCNDLLKALSMVKDNDYEFRCYMAGSGDIDYYKSLAHSYDLDDSDVVFTGWLGHEDIIRLLYSCKALVLPSYHEGFPVVILEAMACGTDVIATNVAAIPEIIDTDLEPRDIERLAELIENFLNYDKTSVRKNRKIVEKEFDIDKLHKRLYTSVLFLP